MTAIDVIREAEMEKGDKGRLVKSILKLLTKRLGNLDKVLENGIKEASIQQLEIVEDKIFDYNSVDEVKKDLGIM